MILDLAVTVKMHRASDKELTIPTQELFFARKKQQNSADDSLSVLLKVLNWLGIDVVDISESHTLAVKWVIYIYPVLANLAVLDEIVMFTIHIKRFPLYPQISVAHVGLCVISLLEWYALHRKRKSIISVIQTLAKLSEDYSKSNVPRSSLLKILLALNVILVLLFALISVVDLGGADFYCAIYHYYLVEHCQPDFLSKLCVFVKSAYTSIVSSLFSNVISLIYCCLCCRCSALLSSYRGRIQRISSSRAYHMVSPELCRNYQRLLAIVDDMQIAFSLPSLLIFLASFMQAFTLLARFLLYPTDEITFFYMMEHVCMHFPSGIFAFLIPAFAAQVLKEMQRNKTVFYRFYEDAIFRSQRHVNFHVLSTLKQMEPIKLSAWEMIDFTGATIPAVIGTLLTYGLLALNLNS